jgi:hypothetical protein
MAQSTKTKKTTAKRSTSRNGSGRKTSASSRSASAKRSNGSRPRSASSSRSRSTTASRNGSGSVADTALEKAKATGRAAADAASKAKTPLIAGGTALAGAAAGAMIKSRLGAGKQGPLKRLGGYRPAAKVDLGKIDVGTVKTVASQMVAYGKQASDIADAVEKTRKKN